MKRATTPTHTFTLPLDASNYSDIHITYAQNEKIVLEKEKEDLTISGSKVSYQLTQQETKFFTKGVAFVQMRVVTTGNVVLASNMISFKVENVLCDDILPIS